MKLTPAVFFNTKTMVLVSVVALAIAWQQDMFTPSGFTLDQVAVSGELTTEQRKEIYSVLLENSDALKNIEVLKATLDNIQWVHHVAVQRDWPSRLVVTCVEEVPIAYWNDDAFINDEGKVFSSVHEGGGELAQLYGPVGEEKLVMQQFQQLSNALLSTGQTIEVLRLDERGAWQFVSGSGTTVKLGKNDILERLQRYMQVVEGAGLMEKMESVIAVDTRYSNGVAVRWKQSAESIEIANNINLEKRT